MLYPVAPVTSELNRRRLISRLSGAATATASRIRIVARVRPARPRCVVDPVVMIDGVPVDIHLSSVPELHAASTGPTIIRVSLPAGSKGTALVSDLGFGLRGYDIKFQTNAALEKTEKRTRIKMSVYVPSGEDGLPLKVAFAPRRTDDVMREIMRGTNAKGSVNTWINLFA